VRGPKRILEKILGDGDKNSAFNFSKN